MGPTLDHCHSEPGNAAALSSSGENDNGDEGNTTDRTTEDEDFTDGDLYDHGSTIWLTEEEEEGGIDSWDEDEGEEASVSDRVEKVNARGEEGKARRTRRRWC